jgi:hypothetical protein
MVARFFEIVGQQAAEPGLPEAFGDPSGSGEKVDGCRVLRHPLFKRAWSGRRFKGNFRNSRVFSRLPGPSAQA